MAKLASNQEYKPVRSHLALGNLLSEAQSRFPIAITSTLAEMLLA